jgi:ABC-type oligopeptide transport system substrate-binding subunit
MLWRRLAVFGAVLVVGPGLSGAAFTGAASKPDVGGTFRVAAVDIGSIDPALGAGSAYADASCALLLRPGGKPEVAEGQPGVSRDGKTYTFHLRRTFRFQTGTRVTAANFAHGLDRSLSPALKSTGAEFLSEVVGAQAVIAGKAQHARGIRASGYTLTIRLTRPAPDFPARLAQPSACAVPTSLPATPEAVQAPFSGAGPYYVAEYIPGSRLVLRRNAYYRGARSPRVDDIVVTVVADSAQAIRAVAAGKADWAAIGGGTAAQPSAGERARVRFLTFPGLTMAYLVMNTSRPLFRDNLPLRRAVNFALDRVAISGTAPDFLAARPADQYLPPAMPGFREAHVYPLRPNLRRAKALARGHTRGRTAVLYVANAPPILRSARIIQQNLARIGIRVVLREFPLQQLFARLANLHEPYDLSVNGWAPAYLDPYDVLDPLLDGRLLRRPDSSNFARFDSAKWNRRLDRAARLRGPARYRAFGKLDVALARDAAPLAATTNIGDIIIVSRRTGCLSETGGQLDLTAVCLR